MPATNEPQSYLSSKLPVMLQSPEDRFSRAWMTVSNCAMMYSWAKVLRIFFRRWKQLRTSSSSACIDVLAPEAQWATLVSFIELFNAVTGFTKSNPSQVFLFCIIRAIVAHVVAPALSSCKNWPHLITVFVWSFGDTIRFGCFLLDALVPGARLAKSIRYTVGPLLFPVGAIGEMMMVIVLAQETGKLGLYVVALLWPIGFFPLMKQLLKQRRKFFASFHSTKSIKCV